MKFLPYGFGFRYTRTRGFVITNDEEEIRPKSPPLNPDLRKVREDRLRENLEEVYPGSTVRKQRNACY